jgi:hypothetical protein
MMSNDISALLAFLETTVPLHSRKCLRLTLLEFTQIRLVPNIVTHERLSDHVLTPAVA